MLQQEWRFDSTAGDKRLFEAFLVQAEKTSSIVSRKIFGCAVVNAYAIVRRTYAKGFSFTIALAFHDFGRRSVIAPPLRLSGAARISIGSFVYIGSGSWLNVMKADSQEGPVIRIGDRFSASGALTLSASAGIEIEEDVLVARNVYISDHSHKFTDPHVPIMHQGIDRVAPVRICRGAWIGQNAVILPGVTIGKGSVVGANSVVRENVPDRSIAAGVPARIIRAL